MDTIGGSDGGLCVLPGRFALDPNGAWAAPLLFVTMQNVFSRMGGMGPIFGILFYLLVVFAAISSSISLLEVIVAHFVDKARDEGKGDKRKAYTLIAAACRGPGLHPGLRGRAGHHQLPHRGSVWNCRDLPMGRRLAGLLRCHV